MPVCISISHFNQQLPVLYQCIVYFLKSSKSLLSLISKFLSCTKTKQMFPLLFKQLILLLQNCKSSCLSVSKSDLTLGWGYFYICPNLTSGGGVLLHLSKSDLRWGYHATTQIDVTSLNSEQQLVL